MKLLVDIGNTRIKWALEDAGRLAAHGEAVHRGAADVTAALSPLASLTPPPDRVLVSSVAGGEIATALGRLVTERYGRAPEFAAVRAGAFGLELAYAQPERLGVDRWLAMVGARKLVQGAVLVVDAGTAVTVDGVTAAGVHLGGAIAPGLELMQHALLTETAHIRDALAGEPAPPTVFAAGTAAAVSAGAAHAVAGLVERAVAQLARETSQSVTLVLTGGDAQRLRPLLARPVLICRDLVLQGLSVYAGEPA